MFSIQWCLSLYRTVALRRWVFDPEHGIDVKKHMKVPWIFFRIVGNMVKKQSYAQGVGRHTEEEVMQVMDEDLQALSKFLGIILYTFFGGGGWYKCSFLVIIKSVFRL